MVKEKTQWVCNYCKSQISYRNVENVKDLSLANRNIEPNTSNQVMMEVFAELRSSTKFVLKKLDKLEADINKIKTEYINARRTTEGLRRHSNEAKCYVKNSTSKMPGIHEPERRYVMKTRALLSPDENILNILEVTAISLERFVYLLAAFTLVFATCKIFDQ
jgi:GTP-binding protein EngB required for normal cell division